MKLLKTARIQKVTTTKTSKCPWVEITHGALFITLYDQIYAIIHAKLSNQCFFVSHKISIIHVFIVGGFLSHLDRNQLSFLLMSIPTTSVIPISVYILVKQASIWLFIHKYQSEYRHVNIHYMYSKSEEHNIIKRLLK